MRLIDADQLLHNIKKLPWDYTKPSAEISKSIFIDVVESEKTTMSTADNNWIKIEDKIPKDNAEVLLYVRSKSRGGDCITLGSFHNGFWFFKTSTDTAGYPNNEYEPVYWMPLPESPLKEK